MQIHLRVVKILAKRAETTEHLCARMKSVSFRTIPVLISLSCF